MDSVTAALHAVTLQHWLGLAAFLSVALVPLGGIWVLSRFTERHRSWQRAAIWISGCFTLLLYAFVAFVFAVCGGGEIGESGKYRLAKAYGAPIVEAIDKYHRANNAYPPTLGSLVPQFLTVDDLRASEASPLESGFRYRADSGRYKLSIEFHGPGVNTCRIQPGSAWICGGLF